MADLEKTVSIIFSGVDKTGDTFSGILKNIDQFSGKIETATQPLANLASGVLKTETALAALAAGGLAYSYTKAIEFEGAVIDLQKVLGDTEDATAAKQAALDLSNQYGVSATNVLQSTANFKQAGFDINESAQLTKNALDLVIAGDVEAAQASEILVAALKGFDAPASDAARLIDVLNGVSNEYATNVEQLGIGMAALSPIAKQAGMSFEETAGVLTPVIEVFRSGDEAAIALKTGLLKLVDDSKPVKDALASIGVSQTDLNGNMRSGKDILLDVSKAFTTLDQNQKLVVASQLVGIDQSARMVTVFDSLGKTTAITNTALKSAGSAAEEVALRLASGEVAVARFKTGFENLALTVGTGFMVASTSAVNGATEIENALQSLVGSGAFDDLFSVVNDMGTEIGQTFQDIAKALPQALELIDWGGFTGSLRGLGAEIQALFDAFFNGADITTAEGLSNAIQKVVNAGTALNNVVSGILSAWKPFIMAISSGIDEFSQSGEAAQKFGGELLGWGQVINTAMGFVGSLSGAVNGLSTALFAVAGSNALNAITGIGSAAAGVVPAVSSLSGALTTAVGTGSLGAQAGFLGLAAAAGWTAGSLLNEYVPAVTTVSQSILGWIDGIVDFTGQQQSANNTIEVNKRLLEAQERAAERAAQEISSLGDELEDVSALDNLDITVNVQTDFEDIQEEWDAITNEIEQSDIRMPEVETNFDAIQNEWDSINQELENTDIKLPVDVDEDSIKETKRKIKSEFKSGSMETIEIGVSLTTSGDGVGPIGDQLQKEIDNMEPVDLGELVDLSGLSELLESINGMDNAGDRQRMTDLALKIADAQQRVIDAEARNLNTRAGLLELESQIQKSKGEADNTIKIEAAGVEPEIEAFMWKILKKIQVRANENGAEFLLAATG